MKKILSWMVKYLKTFFFIFGIIIFLAFCQKSTPQYSYIGNVHRLEIVYSIWSSLLFAGAHMIISVEELDNCISMKIRRFLFLLFCAPGAGIIGWEFGLHTWILFEFANKQTAVFMQRSMCFFSAILVVVIMALIEHRYQKIGEEYTNALNIYKAKHNE